MAKTNTTRTRYSLPLHHHVALHLGLWALTAAAGLCVSHNFVHDSQRAHFALVPHAGSITFASGASEQWARGDKNEKIHEEPETVIVGLRMPGLAGQ